MARRRQLYEGKAKILFEGPEPGTLVQYFKDDATSGNGAKKGIITGKGVLNNRISEYLMLRLAEVGIPNHFVRRLNMREQLIREVEIIPLEVVVRNVAAGSICTRLGIPEGTRLPRSIIEYYYKNDALGDPIVAEEHITAFGWANTMDMDDIVAMTLRTNDFLTGLFLGVGITLVDFKLEFGRLWEGEDMRIVLADEISPDNCRLWDVRTNEKMDKDRFPPRSRQGRGSLPGSRQTTRHPARSRHARHEGTGADAMKAVVTVMLKDGVLDPQGPRHRPRALKNLGFDGVGDVRARQGDRTRTSTQPMPRPRVSKPKPWPKNLLANLVIERFFRRGKMTKLLAASLLALLATGTAHAPTRVQREGHHPAEGLHRPQI